jgi:plastocyanin
MRKKVWLASSAAIVVLMVVAAVHASLFRRPAREFNVTAREMSFYVDGQASANPTLQVRPGEHVRFTVRNVTPGVVHDLAISGIDAGTPLLKTGERGVFEFTAPSQPGRYEYYCRPHALMMRGVLVVGK